MTLQPLADQILAEHRQASAALNAGLRHAIRAGELLLQAKQLVAHGEWLPWLSVHCSEISERTAQAYMRVARHKELSDGNPQRVADLSFREALKLLAPESESRLAEAEKTLESFAAADRALNDIRSRELYREQGYATFEQYCAERWKLSRTDLMQFPVTAAALDAGTGDGA